MVEWIYIAKKELLELKNIKKKTMFIFLITFLWISVAYGISGGQHSVIPNQYALYCLALITSVGFSSQLTADVITLEKKQNTLEILKALKVKEICIIVGKAIPACIIGTFFSAISIVIVKICFLIVNANIHTDINVFGFIIIFLMNYITTNIVIGVSIWIDDEKLMPMLSVIFPLIFILLMLMVISLFINNFNVVNFIVVVFGLIIMSVLSTYISSILLNKLSYK